MTDPRRVFAERVIGHGSIPLHLPPTEPPNSQRPEWQARDEYAFILLLAFVPFVQLGASFYMSVQFLCFVVLLHTVASRGGFRSIPAPLTIGLMLLMFIPLAWVVSRPAFFHSLLRSGREFLCLMAVLLALGKAKTHREIRTMPLLKVLVGLLIIACFVFVVLQSYYLLNGSLFFIPPGFYISNFNTLPDELSLRGGALPRPSAFFAEPSYMGFVGTSLLAIVLRTFRRGPMKITLAGIVLATMILCQTLAGVMSVVILTVFYWYVKRAPVSRSIKAAAILAAVMMVLSAVAVDQIPLLGRLTRIADSSEESSGYARIMTPLSMAGEVLTTRPLGVTPEETMKMYADRGEYNRDPEQTNTDNALLNIVINYGVSSFLIFFVIYRRIKDPLLLLYLLLAAMFNGSFFSYDKSVVLSLVIILTATAFGNDLQSVPKAIPAYPTPPFPHRNRGLAAL
jgi:hypothetical protein